MSVHAGSILHVAGQNVIDRIQSAGLGDVRVPTEVVRETGNREVVDKVPGEPDFTFSLEALDVSTDLMAWLTGRDDTGTGSAAAQGASDPDGTQYDWIDCKFVNICSPWKNPTTGSAGTVEAGHLIPGYYPTRLRYRFGTTDNATQEVELAGGSFFYAEKAPVEQEFDGTGAQTAFTTTDATVRYRKGGVEGTTFVNVFGVLVDGVLQTAGVDYAESGGNGAVATVTFTSAPANGSKVRIAYFTGVAKTYPQTIHASTVTKPAAVRGRNIKVYLGSGGSLARLGGIQTFELEATSEGEVERELGTEDIVGRSVTGTDCNGEVVLRSKDRDAFFDVLEKVTGVARSEVYGWFNQNTIPLTVKIENPKTGAVIKTLYVEDAIFQPPGTPARVNTPTDFSFRWESQDGTFKEIKGAYTP